MASWPQAFDRSLARSQPSFRLRTLLFPLLLLLISLVICSDLANAHRQDPRKLFSTQANQLGTSPHQGLLAQRYAALLLTGNVTQDFPPESTTILDDGNQFSSVPLGGFFETTDVACPLLTRSGFDMRAIHWYYDIPSDTMYIGVDCYGVCGDADGDGHPDTTSNALAILTGLDSPSLSLGEYFMLGIDTSAPETNQSLRPNVIIGSPFWVLTNTGYQSWTIRHTHTPIPFPSSLDNRSLDNWLHANFTNFTGAGFPALGGLVDPAIRLNLISNDSALGDIEFAIRNFAQIPGLNWNLEGQVTSDPNEPGYGKMAFSFAATLGSRVSGPVGSDFIPNQRSGDTVGRRIIISCPWLPLDPFGLCCPDALKDLCGVCGGDNENLDPCGSCRLNATYVPSSSCPGAVSTWSSVDMNLETYETDSLANLATADFNGDGIMEMIIGIPEKELIVIKFMDDLGNVQSTIPHYNPNGASAGHLFGYSVTAIGDVTGDGVPDLAVGAPNHNDVGIVYILVMNSDGTVAGVRQITPPSSVIPPAEPPLQCETPPTSNVDSPQEARRDFYGDTPDSPFLQPAPSAPAPESYPSPNATAPDHPPSAPAELADPTQPAQTPNVVPTVGPSTPPSLPPEVTPHFYCPPSAPSAGVRFGASIVWLGSYFILISAPGAVNTTSVPTPFEQRGAFLLAALANDGNAVGVRVLATTLTNALVSASLPGVAVESISSSIIGREIGAAGTIDSSVRIFTTVHWNMANGSTVKTLLAARVRSDASTSDVAVIHLPNASLPLPSHPDAPILDSSITPPNYVPQWSNTSYYLVAARDVDGDGSPDLILSLQGPEASLSNTVFLIAFLSSSEQVQSTQLIGDRGIGNLGTSLSSGYRYISTLTADSASTKSFAGIIPRSGSTYMAILCIGPDEAVFLYALQLWGSQQVLAPGTPLTPPDAAPTPPSSTTPSTITPSSIIAPNPLYPLPPKPESDPLQVSFIQNSPILKIASGSSVWSEFSFKKIVERSSQINSGPLKTLYFPPPSAWTMTVDGEITNFAANLLDENQSSTSVEVQIQIIHFVTDRTIIFSPSTYLGVVKETVKFSLQLRGWNFVQSKTVLDIVLQYSGDSPIINMISTAASDGQSTMFTLTSTSCDVSVSVPSFASVDGILSSISAPTFNQTASTFILTAPPFFDNLFYDPDVTIKTRTSPIGIKEPKSSKSLLYIIIPAVIGSLLVAGLAAVLLTRICRHKKEEQRWKDAGAVPPSV